MNLETLLLGGIVLSLAFTVYCLLRARLELRRLDRLAHPLDHEARLYRYGGKRKK